MGSAWLCMGRPQPTRVLCQLTHSSNDDKTGQYFLSTRCLQTLAKTFLS